MVIVTFVGTEKYKENETFLNCFFCTPSNYEKKLEK